MRKRKLLPLVCLLLSIASTNAQTADKPLAVGLNFVKTEYNGDYGNGIFDFSKRWYSGGGLSLSTYLNHSFDLGLLLILKV